MLIPSWLESLPENDKMNYQCEEMAKVYQKVILAFFDDVKEDLPDCTFELKESYLTIHTPHGQVHLIPVPWEERVRCVGPLL